MQTAAYSASIILWIFLIFLLVSVISIAAMLISLAKRGDERRKEILSRACCNTFYITVGMLALEFIYGVYKSIALGKSMEGQNPFVLLAVISMVYAVNLAIFKKKYGD